ncbi:MAG: DcaP family trimeric outer membrane transporter [Flavobacteriaceae bacterium]
MRKLIALSVITLQVVGTGAKAAPMLRDSSAGACDIAGFVAVPGTDICVRISGYVGAYAGLASDNVTGLGGWPSYGWDSVAAQTVHTTGDTLSLHAQARLGFDARQQTEYGTLRTFIEMQAEDANAATGAAFRLRHAFIQFGNWTFGKTTRLTAHPPAVPGATEFYGFLADPYRRLIQLRYTRSLGDGLTAAVALEDPAYAQRGDYVANWLSARATASGAPLAPPATGRPERDEIPAMVAALVIEGDWGSAKLAGGLRQNVYAMAGGAADRSIGWRLDAAANIVLTEKLNLLAMTYYAHGFNAHSSLGLGDVVWDSSVPGGRIGGAADEWMVMLGASYAVGPDLKASIAAAFARARPETTAGTALAAVPPGAADVEVLQLLGSLFWQPADKIEIGLDLGYTRVRYGVAAPSANAIDADAVSVAFQAIRRF